MATQSSYPDRDTLLGSLAADGSIGPFKVRDFMAADSGVLTILGDVQAAGAGTVTVELYADAAGTLGGATTETMDATALYVKHLVISPDLYFKLTMSARDTDDIDFYAL